MMRSNVRNTIATIIDSLRIYRINRRTIQVQKINILIPLSISFLFAIMISTAYHYMTKTDRVDIAEMILVLDKTENAGFTPEKLKEYIKELNLKFPEIAFRQAIIESAHFKGAIYSDNHNLFGMRLSKNRATTALGERDEHAYYSNWKQSVIDYALWQAKYAREIETEEQYYKYLDFCYAEIRGEYSIRLKSINVKRYIK